MSKKNQLSESVKPEPQKQSESVKLGFPDTEPRAEGISTAEQWKARLIRLRDRTEPGGQDRVNFGSSTGTTNRLAQQLIRYKELSTPEAGQASL